METLECCENEFDRIGRDDEAVSPCEFVGGENKIHGPSGQVIGDRDAE